MIEISKQTRVLHSLLPSQLSSGSCCIPGSRSSVSQDKQDSVLRPSVPVRPRDTGIEVAKERNWRKRVRFCGRGFEHKYA